MRRAWSRGARAISLISLVFSAVPGCGGDDLAACDDLASALAGASTGDTVRLGACEVTGEFAVPPGVTLRGAGPASSIVRGSPDGVALTLSAGSRLSALAVVAEGAGAIDAPEGGIALEDLRVTVTRGYGIRITDGGAALSRVFIEGPVTADNAGSIAPNPEPAGTATHGLYLSRVGTESEPAVLTEVSVRGFARFGVLMRDSFVEWTGGGADGNLTTGLMMAGGVLTLEDVSLCGTLQGIQPLPAYAGVFTAGARVSTAGVMVCDGDGYGLLHDGVEASHADLVGMGNGDAALWVQRGGAFELGGSATVLSGNRVAGIVLVETPVVTISDARIDGSILGTRVEGEVGAIRVGDGIQAVVASTASIQIRDVQLAGNERVGILLDVGDAMVADTALAGVTVDGSGTELGVVAQSPAGLIGPGAWSSGVMRLGATVDNDLAVGAPLDIVGIVGPMFLPRLD